MRHSSFYYPFLVTFLAIFIGSTAQVRAQEFNNAGEYWDVIISAQNKVTTKSIEYVSKSVHSDNDRIIERKRRAVIKQIDESLARLNELKSFKGNDRFRKEAIAVLEQMKNIYTIEFKEASTLQKSSQSSYAAMERYYKAQDRAEDKLERADKRFKSASKYFAKQNKINIVNKNDGSGDAIKKMGQVNRYTRQIYLIDFKLSKANAGFMDAMNAQKASAMERHRKKTLAAAQEALGKLKAVKDFYGNSDYKKTAVKIAKFRKRFASKEYAELVKVTKNKKRTKKDVMRANKIINELNQKTSQYVQEFNMRGRALRQQYTPKQ